MAFKPTYTYRALNHPVNEATLPLDEAIQNEWEYKFEPQTPRGGRYGLISLPRKLTEDEMSEYGYQFLLI